MQNIGMAISFPAPGTPERDQAIAEYRSAAGRLAELAMITNHVGIYVQAVPLAEFLGQIAEQIDDAVERNK